MKLNLTSLLAGVSLIALAGAANAAQPVVLSDTQMDVVTAGAAATANAAGLSIGDFDATSLSQTATNAAPTRGDPRDSATENRPPPCAARG
jgi:hypothetical protein